jgi:hypothetical protein
VARRGNLTGEEKEARRKTTQRKHYQSHKDVIATRKKARREMINKFVHASQQLSLFAQTALQQRRDVRKKVDDYGKVLEQVYGKAESFDITLLMNGLDDPISYASYTMLLLYFIPQNLLPNPLKANEKPEKPLLDFFPTDTHYRQLCKLIHPDRQSEYTNYSALANAGWELWKETLDDPQAKDALAPPSPQSDPTGFENYCAQGDVFIRLAAMMRDYVWTWCFVGSLLTPTKLTPAALKQSLVSTAASWELLNASLDDTESGMENLENGIEDIIAQGKLFSSALSGQRRNGGRRKNQDGDSEVSRSDEEDEDEDEDEEPEIEEQEEQEVETMGEIETATEEGNHRAGAKRTRFEESLHPSLHRQGPTRTSARRRP